MFPFATEAVSIYTWALNPGYDKIVNVQLAYSTSHIICTLRI